MQRKLPDFIIPEGNLIFNFTNVDFAEKYDDWSYYRNRFTSAAGSSSAVDFVVSINSDELWLIEVKDFRKHKREKRIDLADEIAKKVRDSMAGIFGARFNSTIESEVRIAKLASRCRYLRVAFHLEQPAKPSRLFPISVDVTNLQMKLASKLRFADCHPIIVNMENFPNRLGSVSNNL